MSSPTPAETSAGAAVGLHRRIPMRISRPPAIRKKPQSPQSCIPQAMHRGPCLADPHAPRIPIRATSPYRHSLTMRPPRPAAGLRKSSRQPVPQTNCDDGQPADGVNARRRPATRRRRRRSGAPRSSRPEGRRLRSRAWIPEESGQVELDKSPQARRRIAQGRMADHAGQARRHAGACVRSPHFSTLSRIS